MIPPVWLLDTAVVAAVNVAELAPAATVTVFGAVSAALFELSVTTAPPAGALLDSATVQVVEAPPMMLAGVHCSDVTNIAVIATGAVCVDPL